MLGFWPYTRGVYHAEVLRNTSRTPAFSGTTRPASGSCVALRIAAYDRRITDQAWRGLDAVLKERLLPLGDVSSIRKAAHHVSDLDLSQTKTREYVTALLAAAGKSRGVRVTPRRISGHVGRLTALLAKSEVMRRVQGMRADMTNAERKALLAA